MRPAWLPRSRSALHAPPPVAVRRWRRAVVSRVYYRCGWYWGVACGALWGLFVGVACTAALLRLGMAGGL